MEKKILRFTDTELRSEQTDDGKMIVTGYALKFNKPTEIRSWGAKWLEQISRSAMDTAKLDDVILSFNHNFDKLLAGTRNGSLVLSVDEIGMPISGEIVDTTEGRDVYKLIQEGLINRMSFCVEIIDDEWEEREKELDVRTITKFGRFYDVSAVTFPAYEDTSISTRSDAEVVDRSVKEHFEQKKYEEQMKRLEKLTGGKE